VQRFGRITAAPAERPGSVMSFARRRMSACLRPTTCVRTMRILEREDGKPIDESAIGGWLDEVYSGDLADSCGQAYRRAAREFEELACESWFLSGFARLTSFSTGF